jgi:hypothetical protein
MKTDLSSGYFKLFEYLKAKNALVQAKYKTGDELIETVGYFVAYDSSSKLMAIKELKTSQYLFVPLRNLELLVLNEKDHHIS